MIPAKSLSGCSKTIGNSNALARSRHTWNLSREGQHTAGFSGPSTRETGLGLVWADTEEHRHVFQRPGAYNWAKVQKAWYFQCFSRSVKATVFVEKSPPFLLLVSELVRHFANPRFLFLVRNPYAIVEGIVRRGFPVAAAAAHALSCLRIQRSNIDAYGNRGEFFTYEELCAAPPAIEKRIRSLIPALTDLDLQAAMPVKGRYNEALRNMNEQQIARLNAEQIRVINRIFKPQVAVLELFDYSLL